MTGDDAGVIAIVMALGIPIVAIWTSHQRKMAEIRARSGGIQGSALDEIRMQIAALREDVASLRDTTTKFDMSFDAAISRIEQRVDRIEEDRGAPIAVPPEVEQVAVLGRKG